MRCTPIFPKSESASGKIKSLPIIDNRAIVNDVVREE